MPASTPVPTAPSDAPPDMPPDDLAGTARRRFLPPPGTASYHLLLGAVAIFLLGPLGGITAAYMNFSLGFFVGGQVLAGILGSAVTFGYGAEGRHGANYIQSMAASVAGMGAMSVLIQAMVWLGHPVPPVPQLIAYFVCVGMFGVGVGMLYTPILVDRLQLTYPSGLAVANILRALTDPRLLKRSIGQLGAGTGLGFVTGFFGERLPFLATHEFSAANFGAGMIVGARIGIPALVVGLVGDWLTPYLRSIGWLGPTDPFRKVGFLIALAAIMGAAAVDITLILRQAWQRLAAQRADKPGGGPGDEPGDAPDWKRTNVRRLVLWVVAWGAGVVLTATWFLHLPLGFVLFAIALVFLFVLVNGISQGITDSNPISSAFVICVLLMGALGLKSPGVGLMAAAILLISTSVGCDMQQDRSTGWRLGTNRVVQFRYQVIGILAGAVLAVAMAKLFLTAFPVLQVDSFTHPDTPGLDKWQSAMTYKFVGALRSIGHIEGKTATALSLGFAFGLLVEIARKLLFGSARYQAWRTRSRATRVADFTLDAVILSSPYASSFGGFVNLWTSVWWAAGSVFSSLWQWLDEKKKAATPAKDANEREAALPDDMSTTALIGGGLIAGDSLAALVLGLIGLLALVK